MDGVLAYEASDNKEEAEVTTMINVVRFAAQPTASWRPGKNGRLRASSTTGNTTRLTINESWNEPGIGAPTHYHPGVEEIIIVLEGKAGFWVDDDREELTDGDLIVLPADSRHGFENIGDSPLHVIAAFSAASVPTIYDDDPETEVVIGGDGEVSLDGTRGARPASAGAGE